MKYINNNILWYISLLTSIIFVLYSLFFLYAKANVETSIYNSNINQISKDIKEFYFEQWLKKLVNTEKKSLEELNIWTLFAVQTINSPISFNDCDVIKDKVDKDKCEYNFFFHKYSQIINGKWIIDLEICQDISVIFGKTDYLTERCKFIYAVNNWTKYLNINSCKDLPIESDNIWFTKERCEQNIKYSVFWWDNTLWKYFKAIKERWEITDSNLWNQVINKYWTYTQWKFQWSEIYLKSLSKLLEVDYATYKDNLYIPNN